MSQNNQADPTKHFAPRFLPWLLGLAMLVVYLGTLNHWVTLANLLPVAKVSGAADPAFQSYGCYFPATPTGQPYSSCMYTFVATVTPNTDYQFGCRFTVAAAETAYCATSVVCF